MPLQQLPTVTKDANAHARLGYVRSQSLARTTTFPVERRGRLGKLLPTSALKNVGKTKSTPLLKTPADEHIFSPPDDAHRCSSDAESTRKADRANFRSSSTRPHSYRSPDKCHECVKKGHLHWGEPCEPLHLAISWSSWWCYWAHRRQWERKSRSLFQTSRWGQSPRRRGCGVYRKDLDSLSWHCRARKTCIAGIAKCEGGDLVCEPANFISESDSAWSWCGAIACLPNRTARSKHFNGIAAVRPSYCLASTSPLDQLRNQQELVSVCAKRSLKPPSAWGEWVNNLSGKFF